MSLNHLLVLLMAVALSSAAADNRSDEVAEGDGRTAKEFIGSDLSTFPADFMSEEVP